MLSPKINCRARRPPTLLNLTKTKGSERIMSEDAVINILYDAFFTALKLAGPLLAVSLGVGLLVSLFQAATQIQEQTLTFVPKLLIVGFSFVLLAPWMITVIREFMQAHFANIANFMR